MAFVPVANGASVEIRMLWDGEQVENRIYCTKFGYGQADLDNLTAAVALWWDTDMKPLQSTSCLMREVYGRDARTTTGIESTDATYNGVAGTNGASGSQANNVSLCVSLRTGAIGRSQRGRFYVLGATEGDTSSNEFSLAYLNDVATALQNLAVAIIGAGWSWVVASKRTGGADRVSAAIRVITEILIVDPIIDSMRRRLPGRGT